MESQRHASGCRGLWPPGRKSVLRWGSKTFAPCCLGSSASKIHGDDLAGLWLLRIAAISETLYVKFSSAQSCSVHRLDALTSISLCTVSLWQLWKASLELNLCVLDPLLMQPVFSQVSFQWLPSAASCLVSSVGQRSSLYSLCMKYLVQREHIIAST